MTGLKKYIRDIPGFPKAGIIFKDITPLLKDALAFREAVDKLSGSYEGAGIDAVISVEARGFIFGSAVAYKLKTGIVPVRKKGKLPYKTLSASYDLEYGQDTLAIHEDALKPGFVIELTALKGRDRLKGYPITALIKDEYC